MEDYISRYNTEHGTGGFALDATHCSDPWDNVKALGTEIIIDKKVKNKTKKGICMQRLYMAYKALNNKVIQMREQLRKLKKKKEELTEETDKQGEELDRWTVVHSSLSCGPEDQKDKLKSVQEQIGWLMQERNKDKQQCEELGCTHHVQQQQRDAVNRTECNKKCAQLKEQVTALIPSPSMPMPPVLRPRTRDCGVGDGISGYDDQINPGGWDID
nr:PREDICTED: uncharacterized protein LOC106704003 [Latimeria chalumnae]|eukprot:XP_014345546.1 PREDICTED: uncharacterized protein LOC106704003 [Latimeria chalumnae]